MTDYLSPLAAYLVWHPSDSRVVDPIVNYCFSNLSRNIDKPFSRSLNLPIFLRTSLNNNEPSRIELFAAKTMIFIFISKQFADASWLNYIKEIPKGDNVITIPIAIDDISLSFSGIFDSKNFIRAYDYNSAFLNDYLFIAIAHEIYRWGLNKSFDRNSLGTDTSLKLFLSHAKDGGSGIKLATDLKKFIDNSQMRNFFDATDIAPGYKFDAEIISHIKESTLVAIHSDLYSSRYWCQREILCAKENDRPIISVDTLEDFEDRSFPFASNVPGIHVHINGETKKQDLLRILSASLLETIRFFYSELLLNEYKRIGWIQPDTIIKSRPPEVADIEKILSYDGSCIRSNINQIIYPDPPVYNEEIKFLSNLGVKVNTLLTTENLELKEKKIGLSISDPAEEELVFIGHNKKHLTQLAQDFARHFIAHNVTLIYGGDLRPDGFTEFIFEEAQAIKCRLQLNEKTNIKNYISWPIYNNDTEAIKNWKAKYLFTAEMLEQQPSEDVNDLIPRKDFFLPPVNPQNLFVWSRCLTDMREKMIKDCDIRICAGGRHSGYKGIMPGVLEEIIIAINQECPVFLLGGFGGVSSSVCRFLETNVLPQKLTLEWQIRNNSGYQDVLEYYSDRMKLPYSDLYSFLDILRIDNLRNGLSKEDNLRLFNTPYIDEALYLVLKGIQALNNH